MSLLFSVGSARSILKSVSEEFSYCSLSSFRSAVSQVLEEDAVQIEDQDGLSVEVPIDTSGPNPNGFEMDCLYLDMNGIVSHMPFSYYQSLLTHASGSSMHTP